MIRLTLLLCSAIALTFMIGGRDFGQTREGLIPRATAAVPAAPAPQPIPVRADARQIAAIAPEPAVITDPARMMPVVYVNASSVNVRQGPSTQDSIVGRLQRGDAALIVWTDDTGWSRIRIEGDGIEGYVASRFLTGMPGSLSY